MTTTLLPLIAPAKRRPSLGRPVASGFLAGPPRTVSCERSYPPDLRGSRLTPRGRVVVALSWLVLGVIAAVPILRSDGEQPERPAVTTTMVVDQGDTLWTLARVVDAAADPRAIVDTIVELNGLRSGADIQPGDVLVVPAPG